MLWNRGVCVTLLTLERGEKQKYLGKRVVCSVKRCNFVFENLVCLFSFIWKRRGVVASFGLQPKKLKARRPHFFAQAGRALGAAWLRHRENEHWSTENYQTERKIITQCMHAHDILYLRATEKRDSVQEDGLNG